MGFDFAHASAGSQKRKMKIATFNVNGVNGRLPVLLRWLKEAKPDVFCLTVRFRDNALPGVAADRADRLM
jgi:exodeoxyribonuclease-3